jgi:hypothetical protein
MGAAASVQVAKTRARPVEAIVDCFTEPHRLASIVGLDEAQNERAVTDSTRGI